MNNNFTIGVLGGMGTYATIHLFQKYADVFPAEKEWDRPRIIIDNRCTMPSRVRAFLYKENEEKLVDEMTDSMRHLKEAGCSRIILACNTSHLFLPRIFERVPDLKGNVLHIINEAVNYIAKDKIQDIYLLASEGTIDSYIYQDSLMKESIKCLCPASDEYDMLRECIEAVKTNIFTDSVKQTFLQLINRHDTCILGCTELPILYEMYAEEVECSKVYDPLYIGLLQLKKEYDNE